MDNSLIYYPQNTFLEENGMASDPVTAIANVVNTGLGIAQGAQQKNLQEEQQRAALIQSGLDVVKLKQQKEIEEIKARSKSKKEKWILPIIVLSVLLVIGVVVTIVVVKK